MNILSLFDGISCGQLALNRAHISIKNYFASEIDKHAITVTQHHFPNTIQVGDVSKLTAKSLPKIDLLLGCSPCQGFSFAGKQLNFEDPRSKLFFEYVRLKKELNPTHFLLENVVMKKQSRDIITDLMEVEPIEINSSLFSAQHRRRLYWTNIKFERDIEDKKLFYNKVIRTRPHGWFKETIKNHEKFPTITTRVNGDFKLVKEDGQYEQIQAELCEELQTLPMGYTSMIPKTHRFKAIGNCWTVDVIAHILKGIKNDI